jgi:regulatory protein
VYTISQIKKKLADYCVYQERSHGEVEQKLKGFLSLNEEERGEISIWLIQNNFLNEERFAKSYARGKFYQKKWGKIKISQGLKQKQIPENLIRIGLQEIRDEDYISTIKELAVKKWNFLTDANNLIKKKKLFMYLSRKGFESSLIYGILDDF